MVIYAPAKVNLYLKVLGRRPDGYHNIETIFERIALFDKIDLRSLPDGRIKIFSDHTEVPVGKKSLAYRTVDLLKRRFGVRNGVEVRISKRIPVASGLAGGSSDAACILTGLNRLWRLRLKEPELAEFGKGLGADIPFFIGKSSFAAARGKGDEITPLHWKVKLWHLLVSFPVRLLSKNIYGAYSQNIASGLTKPSRITKILCPKPAKAKFADIKKFIGNDLERVVIEKKPVVGRLKNALKEIGLARSLVTGSGPSVFTLFEKRKEVASAKELLVKRFPIIRKEGWQIFIVPTL